MIPHRACAASADPRRDDGPNLNERRASDDGVDLVLAQLEAAMRAEMAIREWRRVRDLVLGYGGLRSGPDWGSDEIPQPLIRRNGAWPDELAQELGARGSLNVSCGQDLVDRCQRVWRRYREAREELRRDGWRLEVASAIEELRDGEPWTAEQLRQLAGDPRRPALFGGVVRGLPLTGQIVPAGVAVARRPAARGRLVRTWRVSS